MRNLSRALVVACLGAVALPALAAPAAAESASESAAYGAYFFSKGIRKPDASPTGVPNLTAQVADGVSAGRLAVAASGGEDDKISFLFFQLADLPLDASITRAVVTVPLVPADAQNATYAAGPEKVRACAAGPEGFFGEDGNSFEDAPTYDCAKASATATPSPDGTAYVFDVTALAALWAEANDGIALVPNEGAKTAPFQVVFDNAEKATIAVEYTSAGETLTGDLVVDGGSATADLGAGAATFDAGGLSSGTGTGAGTATTDFGLSMPATAPLAAGALPAASAPETAGETPTVATQRTAVDLPVEVLSPTPGFWLAALLLAGGLVFLSLVLGDSRTPALAGATGRPSRLSQALASRRGGAGLLATRS